MGTSFASRLRILSEAPIGIGPRRPHPLVWVGLALVLGATGVLLSLSPASISIAAITLGFLILPLVRFEFSLLAILFLVPFSFQRSITDEVVLSLDLIRLLILPACFLRTDFRQTLLRRPDSRNLLFVLFLLYSVFLSVPRAIAPFYTSKLLTRQFLGVGMCLVVSTFIVDTQKLERLLRVLFTAGALIVLYGYYQFLIDDFGALWTWMNPSLYFQSWQTRVCSFLAYTNSLAGYLNLLLGLALGILVVGRRWRVWLSLLCAGLIVCELLTFSRGGWIGTGSMLFLVLLSRRAVSRTTTALVCVALPLLGVLTFLPEARRIVGERGTAIEPDMIGSRLDLIGVGWNLFSEHPVVGVGVGNFVARLPLEMNWTHGSPVPVHNIYVHALAEYGIMGFLGFFIPLIWLFFSCLRAFPKAKDPFVSGTLAGCAYAIMSVLAHGTVDNLFDVSPGFANTFWVAAGIGSAALRLKSQTK